MLVTYRIESTSNWLRLINLSAKRAGERSAGNLHAPFDVAGDGKKLTVRLVRHSQRKRGAPDRSDLRSMAPFLDPTRDSTPRFEQILLNSYGPFENSSTQDGNIRREFDSATRFVTGPPLELTVSEVRQPPNSGSNSVAGNQSSCSIY